MRVGAVGSALMPQNSIFERVLNRGKLFWKYPSAMISKERISAHFALQLDQIKREFQFTPVTIFDVGAAIGDWALAAKTVFPGATLHAFEPIPNSFSILKQRVPANGKTTHHQIALSDETKESVFHLNEFSFSSSLLPMTARHKELYPFTQNEKEIEVHCQRFDELLDVEVMGPSLLKIDVQGAELKVLQGWGRKLDELSAVLLEVCFEPFYQGQPSESEVRDFMQKAGFSKTVQLDLEYAQGSPAYCDMLFWR